MVAPIGGGQGVGLGPQVGELVGEPRSAPLLKRGVGARPRRVPARHRCALARGRRVIAQRARDVGRVGAGAGELLLEVGDDGMVVGRGRSRGGGARGRGGRARGRRGGTTTGTHQPSSQRERRRGGNACVAARRREQVAQHVALAYDLLAQRLLPRALVPHVAQLGLHAGEFGARRGLDVGTRGGVPALGHGSQLPDDRQLLAVDGLQVDNVGEREQVGGDEVAGGARQVGGARAARCAPRLERLHLAQQDGQLVAQILGLLLQGRFGGGVAPAVGFQRRRARFRPPRVADRGLEPGRQPRVRRQHALMLHLLLLHGRRFGLDLGAQLFEDDLVLPRAQALDARPVGGFHVLCVELGGRHIDPAGGGGGGGGRGDGRAAAAAGGRRGPGPTTVGHRGKLARGRSRQHALAPLALVRQRRLGGRDARLGGGRVGAAGRRRRVGRRTHLGQHALELGRARRPLVRRLFEDGGQALGGGQLALEVFFRRGARGRLILGLGARRVRRGRQLLHPVPQLKLGRGQRVGARLSGGQAGGRVGGRGGRRAPLGGRGVRLARQLLGEPRVVAFEDFFLLL